MLCEWAMLYGMVLGWCQSLLLVAGALGVSKHLLCSCHRRPQICTRLTVKRHDGQPVVSRQLANAEGKSMDGELELVA